MAEASRRNPIPEQVHVVSKQLQPSDSPQQSRLLVGAVAQEQIPMQKQVFWRDTWPHS